MFRPGQDNFYTDGKRQGTRYNQFSVSVNITQRRKNASLYTAHRYKRGISTLTEVVNEDSTIYKTSHPNFLALQNLMYPVHFSFQRRCHCQCKDTDDERNDRHQQEEVGKSAVFTEEETDPFTASEITRRIACHQVRKTARQEPKSHKL